MTKLFASSLLLTLSAVAKASRFASSPSDALCESFPADTMVAGDIPRCYPLKQSEESSPVGQVCVETESFLPDEARDMVKITFDTSSSDFFLTELQAQVTGEADSWTNTASFSSHESLGETDSQTFSLYIPLDRIHGQCCYANEYDEKVFAMLNRATVRRRNDESAVSVSANGRESVHFETSCGLEDSNEQIFAAALEDNSTASLLTVVSSSCQNASHDCPDAMCSSSSSSSSSTDNLMHLSIAPPLIRMDS